MRKSEEILEILEGKQPFPLGRTAHEPFSCFPDNDE